MLTGKAVEGPVGPTWSSGASERPFLERAFLPVFLTAFLSLFVLTLSDYGTNFDTSNGELLLGDHYFYFLTSWDTDYLKIGTKEIDVYSRSDHPPFERSSWYAKKYMFHIWGLGPTLTALSKYIFYTKGGLLDPIDAHHLALGLLAALQLGVLYWFARRYLGMWVAAGSVLALGTYPRYWAHIHNNSKDVPEAVFFTLVITFFYHAIVTRRTWLMYLTALLWGCAWATKANALFIPVILAPFFVSLMYHRWRKGEPLLQAKMVAALVLFPIVGFGTMLLAWPYMLLEFPTSLTLHFNYLLERGGAGPQHWQITPLLNALVTMPLPVMILAGVGLLTAMWEFIRPKGNALLYLLILAWMVVPVLRVMVPGAHDFDVIRHWLEFLPGLALLAGIGASTLMAVFSNLVSYVRPIRMGQGLRAAFAALFLIAWFSPTILWSVRNHPFQLVFYNSLVGGLKGAQAARYPESTDYWGLSYRVGLDWLNENAEQGATVFVGVAQHIVGFVEEVWLREDLTWQVMEQYHKIMQENKVNGTPTYLMYVTRRAHYSDVIRKMPKSTPVAKEWIVDGGVVLRILRVN